MTEPLPDLRSTRINGEWELAYSLAELNPHIVTGLDRTYQGFRMTLRASPAVFVHEGGLAVQSEHDVRFDFPRYYPAMPIEGYLGRPVTHPNVNPLSGFVCLWDKRSSGDTIVDAVNQMRKVISWTLFNTAAEHIMQPKALELVQAGLGSFGLPLPLQPLRMPEGWVALRTFPSPPHRRRLSR